MNKLKIQILNDELNGLYTEHLLKSEYSLFYSTVTYKKLLEKILGCNSYYILAIMNDEIIASFPLMIKTSEKYGSIANSLPFYGSNGCFTINPGLNENNKEIIKQEIIKEVSSIICSNKCKASTFISNPFENPVWYDNNFVYDFKDYRIGQITPLPKYSKSIEDDLLKSFEEPRPRNIRKAIKSNITCIDDNSNKYLDFLYNIHIDNMAKISGKAKKKIFFDSITGDFSRDEYKIYVALHENVPVAAMLLFYFNQTIEYITPVIKEEYRNFQPLSLLVYKAMIDAVQNGFKYWNWGGTWQAQEGVYSFKKKWGARDMHYNYYTKIYDNDFKNIDKEILNSEFPNFYAFPYI